MNLDNFDNYTISLIGRDAFEQQYATTEVVFERMDGTYLTWNSNPFKLFIEPYVEELPCSIEFILENYFPLPELADQLGFKNAWGIDH